MLIRIGAVEAAPAVTQRQHKQVDGDTPPAEVHPRLAPVDLTLVSRCGLEALERLLSRARPRAQRPHKQLHRLVAAAITPSSQLLVQDLRRIPDLLGALAQVLLMPTEQHRPAHTLIRFPLLLAHTAAYRFAIHIQTTRNLRDRLALLKIPPPDLLPTLLMNHGPLLKRFLLGGHHRRYYPLWTVIVTLRSV